MSTLPTTAFLMLQMRLKRLRGRKRLGQHFLADEAMLARIAEAAGTDPRTLAVEIGAGPGFLTSMLAARAGGVLAIELDRRFRSLHQEAFGAVSQVQFLYGDALRLDLADLARGALAERGLDHAVLTGNLPFQITSPLLFAQCGPGVPWRRMTVMVQREVADRITAGPGTKDYGVLTVKLAMWWRLARRWEVPAERFTPPPRVDASVLVLDRRPCPVQTTPPSEAWWPGFSEFVDAAFAQRRKKLINSLASRWTVHLGKDELLLALEAEGHSPLIRAEQIAPPGLLSLYRRLTESSATDRGRRQAQN